MLCSHCSAYVRPIVAVDIDGTLGDYHEHFLKFAADYFGLSPTPALYDGSERFRDWASRLMGITEAGWHEVKLAYRQGGLKRTMPLYPGAAELCSQIRAEGAELWLTTTRPYLRLDNVDPDTREWLRRNGIVFDGLLYDRDKYERLAGSVDPSRVVAVVDDLAKQYDAACKAFGPDIPILRQNLYNTAVSRDNEFSELADIETVLVDRIILWKGNHG